MEFVESFMKFSFKDEDLFLIEEDDLVLYSDGIKACECVVLLNDNIAWIEAKSSSPKIDNEEKFMGFLEDVRKKFAYKIFLIVHGHEIGWLSGLMDALREALREEVHKWNLKDSNIKVYNEELALENHLIVAYVPKADIGSLKQPNGNQDPVKVQKWFENNR